MSDYRRWYVAGGTFFLTIVTYARRPILATVLGRQFLRAAITEIQFKRPFAIMATVLLPDHWHLVVQLPAGDTDYSTRIQSIKKGFTRRWLAAQLTEAQVTEAQHRKGERGIWQPRFWEHMVRDEHDLEECVDYIHWNPRKHGLVRRVRDLPWSSFHRFVKLGHDTIDWGGTQPATFKTKRNWGEPP